MAGTARAANRGALPIGRLFQEEHNKIIDDLERVSGDGIISGEPDLGQDGTSVDCEQASAIKYNLNGEQLHGPAIAGVSLPGTDDITAAKFGCWRFEKTALGAVTATPAIPITSDQAFDTLSQAFAALSAIALTANSVILGYLNIEADTGGFTVGTDKPVTSDAQVVAAIYYDVLGPSKVKEAATFAVGATPEDVAIGAYTVVRNGLELAEIAADAAWDFQLADTIAASKFGGWLFFSDLTGTPVTICIAADGDPLAVSAMAYDTAQEVQDALDALEAKMPNQLVVTGQLIIENDASLWTANTDDLTDASDVTEAIFTARAATETGGQLQAAKINP